ncbi:MAG: ribosomal RNA small subunit methyltransferase A [Deltaproteobacteria bacterium]|nr:ribosomal RNA small subunit methyltransferase A [Deltaproteobacteria bacterium]MBW2224197.1 ribosomal RNA small subunit methyltransferase A [Deltaproteobacteria bacterium]MBW2403402.1 ribosomal RNA small subunit methyltransferase A [Deltaproteobacteria bacterium]MBW2546738.1 ribosomal RNA small subunit methyltransferase A [Deltaproteobacteria bacterium]MBW2718668.1 ribosomal RNA small subunit methyltransferase A [Deltaproteobacteria bacterium]
MTGDRGAPPDARDLLRKYDLLPKRSFSQNFLIQPGAITQIADATAALGHQVVELGPGLGALTYALLERGCHVLGVELDRDMVRVLRAEFSDQERLELRHSDAAKVDLAEYSSACGSKLVVTGNLPYQATGAILRRVIAHRGVLHGAVMMVQREVKDRLVAEPGTKQYGALTVFTRAAFEIETVCRLRPGSFYPAPKVDSAVVRLLPRKIPLAEETETFQSVVRAAFQMRRKTLRNALRALGNADRADHALSGAGIDPGRRGETLSIEEFASLAQCWDAAG